MSEQPAAKPQLHVSGLNLLSRCGEAFRRRYIEGEILPPAVAAVTGTAVDRAVTANLGHKIEVGELLPLEAVLDSARDGLEAAWSGGVALADEERAEGATQVKGRAIDKAVRLALLHATETAPALEPTHVQRPWVVELGGYPYDLAGTIDVQEGSSSIRDTKTSGKTPSASIVDTSDQLTAYALAVKVSDGTAPAAVHLDYLVDLKTPKALTLTGTRDADDFRPFVNRIEAAVELLERGTFMPAERDHWMCSPKWCGYYQTCRFVRRTASVATRGE